MIPRSELYIALSLALAAATAPQGNEPRLELGGPGKADPDLICFDFWPDNNLRIVGTNGHRFAYSTLQYAGEQITGKFVMHVDKASEVLLTFAPDLSDSVAEAQGQPPRSVSLALFGIEQMILSCNAGVDVMMVDSAKRLFPDYCFMLQGGHEPTKDAVYDPHVLSWVVEQLSPLAKEGIAMHVRQHGATLFRAQFPASEYRCLRKALVAIKPSYTW